jgi:uncharacterized protein
MTIEIMLLLFGGGLIAGVINAVGGGSTFMTFPIFLFAGLPPTVANASNFVAVMPGNLMATFAYRAKFKEIGRVCVPYVVSCTAGGLIGSLMLLWTNEIVFRAIIPPLMAFATITYALGPSVQRWLERKNVGLFDKDSPLALLLLFVFSVYGGYFGAGYGVVLLAVLTVMGHSSYHEANAIKNLVITVVTFLGIGLFTFSAKISWPEALTMMGGAVIGGYFGVKFALNIPQPIIRIGIIVLGSILTLLYTLRYWS